MQTNNNEIYKNYKMLIIIVIMIMAGVISLDFFNIMRYIWGLWEKEAGGVKINNNNSLCREISVEDKEKVS